MEAPNNEAQATTFDDLINVLTCPVDMELLQNAVVLFPCAHKINENIAKQIFGEMEQDKIVNEGKCCPLCQRIVKAYYPDYSTREIAEKILNFKEVIEKEALEKVMNELKELKDDNEKLKKSLKENKIVQVFIKNFSNRLTLNIDVNLQNTTVRELAKRIKKGYNIDQNITLMINWHKKLFDGDLTLAEAGIKAESTIIALGSSYYHY